MQLNMKDDSSENIDKLNNYIQVLQYQLDKVFEEIVGYEKAIKDMNEVINYLTIKLKTRYKL